MRFHLLGVLDLVVAITIGYLAGLGPYRPLGITPSTEPLSLLPLALVATVAVPTALALHVVSLGQLRTVTRPRQDQAEDPSPLAAEPRCNHGPNRTPPSFKAAARQ